MRISFLSRLHFFIGIITLFLYFSVDVSPSVHWIMAFLPLAIPLFYALNIGFLFYGLLHRRVFMICTSVVLLVVGFKFVERTYALNTDGTGKEKLNVMSYNVRVFNNYLHLRAPDKMPPQLINWVATHEADIKCFQEFYNYPGMKAFHVIPKIKKNNPYYYFQPVSIIHNQYFGLAIFSRHPILKKGQVTFPKATFNQAIFADVLIGEDTVRIYNVHLQSMSIDEKEIAATESETAFPRLKDLFRRIKRGAEYRSGQIDALMKHIGQCTHKIILAGDLNDTPYSYTYETLREKLNNGFEEKGKGFGFTYNGKLFFLRIDNLFSDKRIKVNTFKTRTDILFSDHYPLEASYIF